MTVGASLGRQLHDGRAAVAAAHGHLHAVEERVGRMVFLVVRGPVLLRIRAAPHFAVRGVRAARPAIVLDALELDPVECLFVRLLLDRLGALSDVVDALPTGHIEFQVARICTLRTQIEEKRIGC